MVTEIKANDNGVCAVTLEDTQNANKRDLAVEGVFVFIGFKPNNKLVPAGIKMNADGYVVTNQNCETKVPGLYVIGDLREKPFLWTVCDRGSERKTLSSNRYISIRWCHRGLDGRPLCGNPEIVRHGRLFQGISSITKNLKRKPSSEERRSFVWI